MRSQLGRTTVRPDSRRCVLLERANCGCRCLRGSIKPLCVGISRKVMSTFCCKPPKSQCHQEVYLHRSTKTFPSHLEGLLFTSEISPSHPRTKTCAWVPPDSCRALLVSFTYMTLRSSFCPIASRSNVGDEFKEVFYHREG